jgi:hypothetical protein
VLLEAAGSDRSGAVAYIAATSLQSSASLFVLNIRLGSDSKPCSNV